MDVIYKLVLAERPIYNLGRNENINGIGHESGPAYDKKHWKQKKRPTDGIGLYVQFIGTICVHGILKHSKALTLLMTPIHKFASPKELNENKQLCRYRITS